MSNNKPTIRDYTSELRTRELPTPISIRFKVNDVVNMPNLDSDISLKSLTNKTPNQNQNPLYKYAGQGRIAPSPDLNILPVSKQEIIA